MGYLFNLKKSLKTGLYRQSPLFFVGILILTLVAFFFFRREILYERQLKYFYIFFGYTASVAALFFNIKAKNLPPTFSILLRGCGLIFTFYTATHTLTLPNKVISPDAEFFVTGLRWLTVCLGILSFWRPAFTILPLLYVTWGKRFFYSVSSIPLTATDYLPILEVGLFLNLGLVIYFLVEFIIQWVFKPETHDKNLLLNKNNHHQALLYLAYCGTGFHLANYFYSGLQKMILPGSPVFWVLENQTQYLLLIATHMKLWPVEDLLSALPIIYPITTMAIFALNFVTLVSQISAPLMMMRIRWLIMLTVLLDIMHLGIFITSGIFFWKWVLFNFSVIMAFKYFPPKTLTPFWRISALACLFIAPILFFTVKLAWYDTRTDVISYITAETKSGQSYRVPSNYFMTTSVTYAQGRLGNIYTNGFGTEYSKTEMALRNNCQMTSLTKKHAVQYPVINDDNFKQVTYFVNFHHQYVMSHLNNQGQINYNAFPHHIWSNPFDFGAFYQLDKRAIDHYTLHLNTVCLDFKDNKVIAQPLFFDKRVIPINTRTVAPTQNNVSSS